MTESVRLVIWDLDETFWKGTISEGGLKEYVRAHHDIVIALAERGIISSICSKNDEASVRRILDAHSISEYFVFPSISWAPKGPRVASIIESAQLRPATVMFIDDNPNNLAEALSFVPDLQVENESFIGTMLADARFKGKEDRNLNRLKQYQLLQTRKADAEKSAASNEDFLRSCDVRVYIEYDVIPHLDRAVELVNRTNQLNYTKRRLPEDMDAARALLRDEIEVFTHQAGLVRVVDKYGDYGYVGFFLTKTMRMDSAGVDPRIANATLLHYCFSCRTLGMLVEQWVYEHLRRPHLTTVGEVLTDLGIPRVIDWIRLVPTLEIESPKAMQVAPKMIFWGGCEANAVGVYLSAFTSALEVYGSYAAGPVFVRANSAVLLDEFSVRDKTSFEAEARALRLPLESTETDIYENLPSGSVLILNCMLDATPIPIYRHKVFGWIVHVEPPYAPGLYFHTSETEFKERMDANLKLAPEQKQHLLAVRSHIAENYENLRPISDESRITALRRLIERTPEGVKVILALDHDEHSNTERQVWRALEITHYCSLVQKLAMEYPFVRVVSYGEVLNGHEDLRAGGGNHYGRLVYHRFAQRIIEVIQGMPSRDGLRQVF